ncbi:MAG: response regulator [Acidobacteria bacterium]|nr:response regulator [Acidobacteriota bacterium]
MAAVPPDTHRILIVDDEPAIVALLRRILAPENVDILTAHSGAEALALARRLPLDLVILDVKLPDLSGVEVLRRIRRRDAVVPVIIITSYGSPETVRAAMTLGAVDYLTKPFDSDEIRRAVRAACRLQVPSETTHGRV